MIGEDLNERAAEIRETRRKMLCADESGLGPLSSEHHLRAQMYLQLAESELRTGAMLFSRGD